MTLNYNVIIIPGMSFFFKNSYSYTKLRVTNINNTPPAFYISIPSFLANDDHVQSFFTPSPDSPTPPNDIFFDVYFPLFSGTTSLDLSIYPQNTDINNINSSTPSFIFTLSITNPISGNAFLLGLEDKEKNVRVLQTLDTPDNDYPTTASYKWTGTSPEDTTQRIANCIAHVTTDSTSTIFNDTKYVNNGTLITPYYDPLKGGKGHLYFMTDNTGFANLTITSGNTPTSCRFIYFPFAERTSEVARIVIFNKSILAKGLKEAVPSKNPFNFIDDENNSIIDKPIFYIKNDNNPKIINNGNYLYVLVNNFYDSTIPSIDDDLISFEITKKFITTSPGPSPEPNQIRYIYTDINGNVFAARQYAFFCYGNTNDNQNSNLFNFDIILSGNNEAPRIDTLGTGKLIANYSSLTKIITYNISYINLSSALSMAHFHGPGTENQNVGIQIDLTNQKSQNPIIGTKQLTEDQERDLLSGLWYCNLHTVSNPSGELRGQMWPWEFKH